MAVRLLDFGPKLGYLKDLRPLGGLLFKIFLIVLKCLFKYYIVVMLTLLTQITLLKVNVNML